MKYGSKKVVLSFICERALAKVLEELAEIGQLPLTIQIEIERIYWREYLCLRLSKPAPSKN